MRNKLQPQVIQDQVTGGERLDDCNCDCACATSTTVVGAQTLLTDLGIIQSLYPKDFHTTLLNAEYTICHSPFTRPVVVNRAVLNVIAHSKHNGKNISANFNGHMHVDEQLCTWLHLTDNCNLGCAYCYLHHTRSAMTHATGHAAIDAIFRSALLHGYGAVKLKFAGGEPLLCFPLILDLHQYAQSLAEKHNINLDGVVLSNGIILTSQKAKQIQAAGLRLMISLDGIGEMHDRQRHYPDGRGSFDQVVHAIDHALSIGLIPDISITISGRNAEGLPEVVAWVLERDLPFSLNFYRENDLSASQSDLHLEDERIINGMLAAYKVIEDNLPRRNLLASLMDRASLSAPHLRTCSIGQSYMVFDTKGRIARCQMDITNPITNCNDPDPLSTLRNNTTSIINPSVNDKEECATCQWRYWCGGGCPLQAYRATGRYDTKSPYCAIYQKLFPQVIRIEGLRLLKYANEHTLA